MGCLLAQAEALALGSRANMTKTGFIIANLFRKKARTTLTLLSVMTAFLLFGLLQAVNVLFDRPADFVGITRLITQARVSLIEPLPIRLLAQIRSVPGVKDVAWVLLFGGKIGPNSTPTFGLAADPQGLRAVSPQWVMPDEQWQAFANKRTSMIAGRLLAQQYGWKIGDRVPIKYSLVPQRDGSRDWTFDLVGIFDGKDPTSQKATQRFYVNYAYVDEANANGQGNVSFFVMSLTDAALAGQVAQAIDAQTENSPDETKTQTEQDFTVAFIRQIADVGLIVRWIMFAVFFTLLLVVGNTMAQAVRERVPELAVLKTLGFSNESILGFVLAEAAALCAIGGVLGLGLATLVGIVVAAAANFPLAVNYRVWAAGIAAIAVLSVATGLVPALRARKLSIVDALAGR
jgi:putative ABC transport system permease protein